MKNSKNLEKIQMQCALAIHSFLDPVELPYIRGFFGVLYISEDRRQKIPKVHRTDMSKN